MAGIIPADDLRRLQQRMNRLMQDLGLSDMESRYIDEMNRVSQLLGGIMEKYDTSQMGPNTMMPLADVRETDGSVIVTMDLPGVDKQDVDISVTEDELRVVAETGKEAEAGGQFGETYHTRERTFTRFERMVKLPVAVKGDQATARLDNGVLAVTLPKEIVISRRRVNIE
jgi:HSP20 family protein